MRAVYAMRAVCALSAMRAPSAPCAGEGAPRARIQQVCIHGVHGVPETALTWNPPPTANVMDEKRALTPFYADPFYAEKGL
jgi:hypothetical protein